ncbi:hypothetical protein [Bacillus sp. JJ1773]
MLRKTCIRLSISLKTSMDYFMKLTLYELGETIKDAEAVMKEK